LLSTALTREMFMSEACRTTQRVGAWTDTLMPTVPTALSPPAAELELALLLVIETSMLRFRS
jgi:hypothetical protein